MEVPVTLAVCGIAEMALVTRECLKHVIFMHSQIPSPFDDFRSHILAMNSSCEKEEEKVSAKARRVRRRGRRGLEKVLKFTDDFTCLMNCLQPAFSELKLVRTIAIILGNSPTRPRELYQLDFEFCTAHSTNQVLSQGVVNACPRSPLVGISGSDAVRKVIRAMISCGLPYKERGPLKLFILLFAPPSSIEVPCFLSKREFSLKHGKANPVFVKLRCGCDFGRQSQEPAPVDSNQDFIWYQCQQAVRGLRIKQSNEE